MTIVFAANPPATARVINAITYVLDRPKVNVQRMTPVRPAVRIGLRPMLSL